MWGFANAQCCDSQCDVLVEEFEEVIEDWYRNHQEEDLTEFLCANHVLKGKDTSELEGRYRDDCILCSPLGRKAGEGKRAWVTCVLRDLDEM